MKYGVIYNNNDEGFKDISLHITTLTKKFMGDFYIECYGKYMDKEVGIGLYIKSNMQGIINNDINTAKFYKNGIKIVSLGECSDNFIKAMAEMYELDNKALKLKNEILVECIPLQGNSNNIKKEFMKLKCFLNAHENLDNYAEFYINIDVINSKVFILEKSPEYRENIINSLSN